MQTQNERHILDQLKSPPCLQAAAWVEAQPQEGPPPEVLTGLATVFSLVQSIASLRSQQRSRLTQLLRALGIIPSSERRQGQANKPKADGEPRKGNNKPRDRIERLKQEIAESERRKNWHSDRAKAQGKNLKMKKKKLDDLMAETEAYDYELTEEEKLECKKENELYEANLLLGQGADPSLAGPAEALMSGGFAALKVEEESCRVDRDSLPKGSVEKRSFSQIRERIDAKFCVTQVQVEVEKLVVEKNGETTIVAGDMLEYGPAKMAVTWNFLVHMALMVTQFAMPLHRFAKLVSSECKRFTSAEMSRYYRTVAEHFVAIYIHLGLLLADAPVLSGDDTPSLVLEVAGAQKDENADPAALPWASYATQAKAKEVVATQDKPKLAARLAQVFGFASPRKDGKGDKRGFNTSLLTGREVADDPKSTIVFYRSHLGSVGNLLDAILQRRQANKRELVIQTDLSTTNLVNHTLSEKFDIRLAGCAAHARRPFALNENEDPLLCDAILHLFKGIPITEERLDLQGRNMQNTRAVRDTAQRSYWEGIRDYCLQLGTRWSKQTALGQGARYVIKNYERLTYYLTDPRISPSNNMSERMLRQETLIQNNALFRATLDGRGALDIMRTILQTAMAAEVDPAAYLKWVLMMPKESIDAEPQGFTPRAYAAWLASQVELHSPTSSAH